MIKKKFRQVALLVTLLPVAGAAVWLNEPGQEKGYDRANMDLRADPCTDFYQYAVGGWMKNNPIPATESRWGSFNILTKQNEERLQAIIDQLQSAKNTFPKGSPEQQVRDFYYSATDTVSREQLGIKPIQEDLTLLRSASDKKKLAILLGRWKQTGIGGFFGAYVSIDAKNSQRRLLHFSQGGLALPDVDYYLKTDPASVKLREEYRLHISRMLKMAGHTSPDQAAGDVLELETALAKMSMSRTERRDPEKTYNLTAIGKVMADNSGFEWKAWFKAAAIPMPEEVVVSQVKFLKESTELWKQEPLEKWKNLIFWQLIDDQASLLSLEMERENFNFYSTILKGTSQMKPLHERALNMTNAYLGEPLGLLFLLKHFSPESKKRVTQMVEELRDVFKERILALDWMGDTTKQRALEKLAAFKYKIGYPDEWRYYFPAGIEPAKLLQNVRNVNKLSYERMVKKLNEPVNPTEWGMTPQTVNAYYSSSRNEIVIPMGILQAPFFDPEADDALNYGGIGAVIGHELSHGFDDKGSKFDGKGNLNSWWTPEDRVRFEARTNRIVQQFNRFEVFDSTYINGSLTQGENIADLAGLTLAFYALKKHYNGKEPVGAGGDGFTWKQRFFLGWSLVWAQNITEKELCNSLITDPHAPGRYRVLGPLSNMPEFREAFPCIDEDAMVAKPENMVVIW